MWSDTCYNTGLGSFQKWHIGNDVRTLLLDNEDLVAKVGSNIFPLVAPENTDGSFILYAREKYAKLLAKQGVYEDDCQVAITAVADNYDEAADLAELIDNTLTGKHETANGEKFSMVLTDSSEAFEDNKFIETLLFEIK